MGQISDVNWIFLLSLCHCCCCLINEGHSNKAKQNYAILYWNLPAGEKYSYLTDLRYNFQTCWLCLIEWKINNCLWGTYAFLLLVLKYPLQKTLWSCHPPFFFFFWFHTKILSDSAFFTLKGSRVWAPKYGFQTNFVLKTKKNHTKNKTPYLPTNCLKQLI